METRTLKVPRVQYREFEIVGRGDVIVETDDDGKEVRKYPLTFSSADPLPRWSWDGKYMEILSHDPSEVDLSVAEHGLPLLKSHQRLLHQGSVEDVALLAAEQKLAGNARFSSITLGQEGETMVREEHTKRVSVGYEILGAKLESTDENGLETWRMKWRPLEVSTEPIPLDQGVGFGRSNEAAGVPLRERADADEIDMVEFTVTMEDRAAEPLTEGEEDMAQERKNPEEAPTTPEVRGTGGPVEGGQPRDRGKEAAEIIELAAMHGMAEQAADWIRENKTVEQVQKIILDHIRTNGVAQPASEEIDLMSKKDRGRYSIARALRMQVEMHKGMRREYDGVEYEVHQELEKQRSQQATDHGGILVPWRSGQDEEGAIRRAAHRTLGTTEPTGGATLVGEVRMPEMIDVLRNRSICVASGARFLTNLSGVVVYNRKTGTMTVHWVGENPAAGVTPSDPSYGEIRLGPKTLQGTGTIPRQLIVQTSASFDVEADLRLDLGIGTGLAYDRGGLHGIGADKQPLGLWNTPDVLAETIDGVPTFGKLVNMAAKPADQNADFGSQRYVTTPLMAGVLKQTPVVDGYPTMIWDGDFREGRIAGYPASATNQISKTLGDDEDEHGIVFGNWRDLAIATFGNDLELVVDPYTAADSAQIKVTSFAMADAAVLRPESFCIGTGAVLEAAG